MAEAALRAMDAVGMDAVGMDAVGTAPLREGLPVLPALRGVLPGGLRPGSPVGLAGRGAASLGLALVAGVSRHSGPDGAGGWCAVVGVPGFGVAAAAAMGAVPDRLLLVDDPGDRWPDVVAALTEAVDLILLDPADRPGGPAVRRLSALARRHGCVLALTGPHAHAWPAVRLSLRLEAVTWHGLADGHGRLTARQADVVAQDHGPARRTRLWFPAADGTVAPVAVPPLEAVVPGGDARVSAGAPAHRPVLLPPAPRPLLSEGA
ncbi:hypothetical protein [Spirillospora albida]|uniref:hypothetical protein n=1 Tax=Spirillospora albida TaxID=58123 RepID=UPI000A904805|nr:hypothetical protein [Spirillospora albida]